jgi:hypothetical protein
MNMALSMVKMKVWLLGMVMALSCWGKYTIAWVISNIVEAMVLKIT